MASIFENKIIEILKKEFPHNWSEIYRISSILQYVKKKTQSANKGSKSRSSFGSLYALYVLIEDYIKKEYHLNKNYQNYLGANFSDLFNRQRQLPFGRKLQNHALNHRLNQEFAKLNPLEKKPPIIRDQSKNKYWINETLLIIEVNGNEFNIGKAVLSIIDTYIETKKSSLNSFLQTVEELRNIDEKGFDNAKSFIKSLLQPNVDARIFEIVSFSILKYHYNETRVYFGFDPNDLNTENLRLYKTGRTNANDGGIDFVMKPLGRFFQVTETTDVKKYFLDIDKLEKYPISFVVKSEKTSAEILKSLEDQARKIYPINSIIEKYMNCIEDVINIPKLLNCLDEIFDSGRHRLLLEEIVLQCKVEFNFQENE